MYSTDSTYKQICKTKTVFTDSYDTDNEDGFRTSNEGTIITESSTDFLLSRSGTSISSLTMSPLNILDDEFLAFEECDGYGHYSSFDVDCQPVLNGQYSQNNKNLSFLSLVSTVSNASAVHLHGEDFLSIGDSSFKSVSSKGTFSGSSNKYSFNNAKKSCILHGTNMSDSRVISNDISSFTFDAFMPQIYCRSFPMITKKSETLLPLQIEVSLEIQGMKLITTSAFHEDILYNFVLKINNIQYIAWRHFKEFQSLANACESHSTAKTLIDYVPNKNLFINTRNAWKSVVCNHDWSWLNIFYNQPKNLFHEAMLIQNFMKEFLFEVPNIVLLLEFFQ
eukprot:gene10998-14772_t